MRPFRQSTVVTLRIGPCLDSAGAEYTGLVIGDLTLTKAGTSSAMAAAATLTHITNGHYSLVTIAGNTDTLGSLRIDCNKATYQIPAVEGEVLPATVYDALVANATTAVGGLGDIQRMSGTTLTARDIGASVLLSVGTGTGQVNLSSGAVPIKGNVKKNTALATFPFLMTDSTNHNPATGKTVTCTRSIDGAAFGAGTLANVTEVANGIYVVDFLAADLNGNNIILRATATGCDDTFERLVTYVA